MNDTTNLYLALTFPRTPPAGEATSLSFDFDNDASSSLTAGDDGFGLSNGLFQDTVRSTAPPCPAASICSVSDTDVQGVVDGAGAFANDGATSIYELRHPLRSGDSNDFGLVSGNRIGTDVSLRLVQTDGALQDTIVPGAGAFFLLNIR
jgi:hypothetical protein